MNTRFAVAVHIVTYLASRDGEPATSELVAASVGTHPALIRRIGAQLARAGVIRAQRGAGGGAVLARPMAEITLLDIYSAVGREEHEVIGVHRTGNPCCSIGRNMQRVLDERVHAVERAVERELAGTTVADLVGAVAEREVSAGI